EVGTVTPRPQAGNPQPRLFRLPRHRALINRMGFNNDGVDALVRNVSRASRKGGLLGINIGRNKDTPNEFAEGDYLFCLERVYPLAEYITDNISSPNTAGLRELQEEQALRRLVGTLRDAQERLGALHGKRVPMLVKIAPDLTDDDVEAAGRVLGDLQVDGVVATNTTVSRIAVQDDPLARETGGLSGAPLMEKSTAVLRMLRSRLPESIPLIGVGGIFSGADAAKKMAAGANLVQLYTGLVYRGPEVVGECADAMRRRKEAPTRRRLPPGECAPGLRQRPPARLPGDRAGAAGRAQHLRGRRACADAGRSLRCRGAAGTVLRLRDAARRPGAGAGRRQQPAVRRRPGRRGAGADGQRHAHARGPGRHGDRPRRRRRRVARAGAVDLGARAVRAGESGADPRDRRRRADPEHRRLRGRGART